MNKNQLILVATTLIIAFSHYHLLQMTVGGSVATLAPNAKFVLIQNQAIAGDSVEALAVNVKVYTTRKRVNVGASVDKQEKDVSANLTRKLEIAGG